MRAFRETLWFKKGKQDEETRGEVEPDGSHELPVEDRYDDDGSITAIDHAQWTLRTGVTQPVPTTRDIAFADGTGVHEKALVNEMKFSRRSMFTMIGVSVAVVSAAVAIFFA